MKRLSAEDILAGSAELERKNRLVNEMMRLLLTQIVSNYELASGTDVELGRITNKFVIRFSTRTIMDVGEDILQIKELGPNAVRFPWQWSNEKDPVLHSHPRSTNMLWGYRDRIVEFAVTKFPKIREHLSTLANCAPSA